MTPPDPTSQVYRFHKTVLALIAALAVDDPSPDTPEGLLLLELAKAVEAYEKAVYPV